MLRVTGAAKIICALGCAGMLAAATTPAIASATESQPAANTPSDRVPAITEPIAAPVAADRAGDAYDEAASTAGTSVPIVTVETTPTGPKIVAHPVTSESQARAVAEEAAAGEDLVVVQSDTPVETDGATTNDQFSRYQWSMDSRNTSFVSAWPRSTGAGIVVAVVDTGVATDHPDLAGQVLPGRTFLNGSPTGVATDPMTDACGHGTHVAGTIAALAGNSIGVAGAAPGVKILPVKVLNCSGYSSDVANGIKWAADQGARVINLSLGAPGPNPVIDAAVAYAHYRRVVVVAAAGNNHGPKSCSSAADNARSYPGASPGAIGVGAIGKRFTRACFSNTGNYVDLVAPGVKVLSTYPPAMTSYGYAPYTYMSGTSMAAPHVSAAAAMVLSRRPGCSPDRVERRLKATARRLSRYRRTNAFGYGLVDPARAVSGNAC